MTKVKKTSQTKPPKKETMIETVKTFFGLSTSKEAKDSIYKSIDDVSDKIPSSGDKPEKWHRKNVKDVGLMTDECFDKTLKIVKNSDFELVETLASVMILSLAGWRVNESLDAIELMSSRVKGYSLWDIMLLIKISDDKPATIDKISPFSADHKIMEEIGVKRYDNFIKTSKELSS